MGCLCALSDRLLRVLCVSMWGCVFVCVRNGQECEYVGYVHMPLGGMSMQEMSVCQEDDFVCVCVVVWGPVGSEKMPPDNHPHTYTVLQ